MHHVPAQPARTTLALSLVLSVVVHVCLFGGAATYFGVRALINQFAPWLNADEETDDAEKSQDKDPLAPTKPDDVVWIRPGIDDGDPDNNAWIGYKDATEHAAYQASVDQSAMTEELPGMEGEEQVAAPRPPVAEATPPAPPLPDATVDVTEAPTPDPAIPDAKPVTTQTPATESPESPAAPVKVPEVKLPETPALNIPPPAAIPPVVTFTPEPLPVPEEAVEEEKEQDPDAAVSTPEDKPEPPPPATDPKSVAPDPGAPAKAEPAATVSPETPTQPSAAAKPAPPSPPPQPSAIPAGSPGERADKEADATSIKNAVEYRYGRVRAGEGIDIKTIKPEFSNFTLLTSLPRVPVVEITFTARGKVKNVRMVQSSGYKDVDEPILNAVWAWSAKGKKLEALAKENPNAELRISVRMLL